MNRLEEWMREEFEPQTLLEMAEHGMDAGWPHLTYYSDTTKIMDKYGSDVEDELEDYGEPFTFDPSEEHFAGFVCRLVWAATYSIACRIIDRCAYCNVPVLTTDDAPPDEDDDEEWAELAKAHESHCEWIETRAHFR